MRLKLAMSPWWVQGLVYGVLFGVVMTVFYRFQVGRWAPAVLGGVVGGVLFGILMGRTMSRLRRRVLVGCEGFSPVERQTVLRATWRGPVPTDPRLHEAARGLLQRRRDETVRTQRRSVVSLSLLTVLSVVLVLTQMWW